MRAELTRAEGENRGGQPWAVSSPTLSQSEPARPTTRTVLTVAEVAEQLRCSKAHVYKAIEGKVPGVSPLPAIFMGRRKLVRLDTLELWKRTNEKSNSSGNILSSPKVDAALRT